MQVYDSANPGNPWVVAGGTSLASPLIAAYYAVIGSAGQGPSWPYLNASALNDPSTGSNNSYNGSGNSCTATLSSICNSGPGYDGPTGVGSISGAVASGAPGIAGPGTNGSYTQSVTADTAQLQGGVYPNGSDTTYWWEYGTTTSYGQQTATTDAGAGSAPQSVTGFLTGLQPATTYHYRLVAQNSAVGTEYGYDFTFTTPPSSTSSPTQSSAPTQPPATTTTSSPPVIVRDRPGEHRRLDARRAGHHAGSGRRGRGQQRDDQRHDRDSRGRDDVRALLRTDGGARPPRLELAHRVLLAGRERQLEPPQPVAREDVLPPGRREQRRGIEREHRDRVPDLAGDDHQDRDPRQPAPGPAPLLWLSAVPSAASGPVG